MILDNFTPTGKKILIVLFWTIIVIGLIITKDINV